MESRLVYTSEVPKLNKKQKRKRKQKRRAIVPLTIRQQILKMARQVFALYVVTMDEEERKIIITVSVKLKLYDEQIYSFYLKHDGMSILGDIKFKNWFLNRNGRVHGSQRSLVDFLEQSDSFRHLKGKF